MTNSILVLLLFIVAVELFFMALCLWCRNRNQWFIVKKKDLFPVFDRSGLEKFFSKGYDEVLGWVRKPSTKGNEKGKNDSVAWTVNSDGARSNLEFDKKESTVSLYGDSFTFARQVEDTQTWAYLLSKKYSQNFINFGVGNYGFDQALLRLEREYDKHPTETVIIGVVPDTISRIMSSWKHYYEYGNTFAFKPKFYIENGELKLQENLINDQSKFLGYKKYLNDINNHDYFFERKFKKELIKPPYSFSFFKNIRRNSEMVLETLKEGSFSVPPPSVMRRNLEWRKQLFTDDNAVKLLKMLLLHLKTLGVEKGFKPHFVFMPQKDDVTEIKRNGHFYSSIVQDMNKILPTYDFATVLTSEDLLDELYCDQNDYGGHMSYKGNKLFAEYIDGNILN